MKFGKWALRKWNETKRGKKARCWKLFDTWALGPMTHPVLSVWKLHWRMHCHIPSWRLNSLNYDPEPFRRLKEKPVFHLEYVGSLQCEFIRTRSLWCSHRIPNDLANDCACENNKGSFSHHLSAQVGSDPDPKLIIPLIKLSACVSRLLFRLSLHSLSSLGEITPVLMAARGESPFSQFLLPEPCHLHRFNQAQHLYAF